MRKISNFLEAMKIIAGCTSLNECEASEEFQWCTDCKEYDQENHCCHRFSKVIRESLNEHTDAVLEDIKAELEQLRQRKRFQYKDGQEKGLIEAIAVIDKHISEKENKDGSK